VTEILNLAELERRAIDRALSLAGGSYNVAAALLGISRSSLYRKRPKGRAPSSAKPPLVGQLELPKVTP
jgi:DNA-binding NtrC family response regulator